MYFGFLALAAVGVVAAFQLDASRSLAQAVDDPAFENNCSECHTFADAVDRARAKDYDDPAKSLDTYLARHHARDNAERRAVIALLIGELIRPAGAR